MNSLFQPPSFVIIIQFNLLVHVYLDKVPVVTIKWLLFPPTIQYENEAGQFLIASKQLLTPLHFLKLPMKTLTFDYLVIDAFAFESSQLAQSYSHLR